MYPVTLSGRWTDAFKSLPAAATATALAAGLSPIAGSMPSVVSRGDYFDIVFDATQEERVSEWILAQLNREPGPVRMELGGVALKVITRKYWPWFAGAVALGAVLGYYGGRR